MTGKVPIASAAPNVPPAAMMTILAGLLLFLGATLVPARVLAQIGRGAVPGVRLGIAAVGLSLVLGTVVALLSSS